MAKTSSVKVRIVIRLPKRLVRIAQRQAKAMAVKARMEINFSQYVAILIAAQEVAA